MNPDGLLWFDPDKDKPLTTKITDALARYRRKFGAAATIAHVNSDQYGGEEVAGVQVYPRVDCLKHHIWVGGE